MDNKLEVTIHMPLANHPYSVLEEVVVKQLDKFENLPITMGEEVVGICRRAYLPDYAGVIEIDAVIWGKVCGVNFLRGSRSPMSITIAKA